MKTLATFFLVLLTSISAFAKIEVAFLEVYGRDGKPIELEKGGRFAHVAVRIGGLWLHAHPVKGVELTDDISEVGEIVEILVHRDGTLAKSDVEKYFGLPYDAKFNWDDSGSSYCSKLVANILNVPPRPMRFDGSYWERYRNLPWGEPGVSPNGLYGDLLDRGYSPGL